MNFPELRDTIERDGFALLPPILDEATLAELTRAIEHQSTLDAVPNRRGQFAMRHLLERVPKVREIAQSPAIRDLMRALLGDDARVVRGLLFDKTPQANWKVPWHQDLTIAVREKREIEGFGPWSLKDDVVHVQPPVKVLSRMLTLRLHLDDCDESNGALRVLPGSHRVGKLSAGQIADWRERTNEVLCSCKRGEVLLMQPLLLHASSAGTSPHHRRVVHLEGSADELPPQLEWHERA